MPRPTSLTPELQTQFIALLQRGHFPENVAAKLGIDPRTYHRWMKRGRAGEEPYCQFSQSVQVARSEGRISLVDVIRNAADEDPKWAAWMIERTDKRYRPPQTTAHVTTKKEPAKLGDAEYLAEAKRQLAELGRVVSELEASEGQPAAEAQH